MRTLAIRGGDLVLGRNGHATVSGPQKVRQDLGLAVREPYGCDRFNRRWGSLLPNYVGEIVNEETAALVRGEVTRLIQNHVMVQQDHLADDVHNRRKPRFVTGEIIDRIESIDIRQEVDRLMVRVRLRSLSDEQITLIGTVT